jgi:hypothetical protein
MIKIIPTDWKFKASAGAKLVVMAFFACVLAIKFLPEQISPGFCVGVGAFCLSAVSLERLAIKVLGAGELRSGVRSGIFWALLKFVGPVAVIFVGISHGVSPVAMVLGMVLGLVLFALILWVGRK